jgi:hypothetical protein
MKEPDRIDYLVKMLAGNNAKLFAEKCDIDPKAISNMRHGLQKIGSYAERIHAGYPEVSIDWLLTGKGKALRTDTEKGEVLKKMESLEKEVRRLSKLVEKLVGATESANKSTNNT